MATRRFSSRMDDEERGQILDRYDSLRRSGQEKGEAIKAICFDTGRDKVTIYRLIAAFADSSGLATRYVKSQAMTMIKKIVEKGDVDQLIDVVSRPNIGVLQPIIKGNNAPQILVSVTRDSLGGVSPTPAIEGEILGTVKRITEGFTPPPVPAESPEAVHGDIRRGVGEVAEAPPAPSVASETRDAAAEVRKTRHEKVKAAGKHSRPAFGKTKSPINLRYDI